MLDNINVGVKEIKCSVWCVMSEEHGCLGEETNKHTLMAMKACIES